MPISFNLILAPDKDGCLHIPLPPELRQVKVHVEGTFVPVADSSPIRLGLLSDLKDKSWVSPDFDEPLEDFREYME